MRIKVFILYLSCFFVYACSQRSSLTDENQLKQQVDSILNSEEIPENSKGDSLSKILKLVQNDTLRNELLSDLSYFYSRTDNSRSFKNWNRQSRELSIRLQDTSKIGYTFWDTGHFYYRQNMPDSAYANYSKGYNLFVRSKRPVKAATLMLNMAITQKDIKDYAGSEVSTTKVIQLLEDSAENKLFYKAHNNLGIVYNELEEYTLALKNHELALSFLGKMDDEKNFRITTLNNQGVLLQGMADYKEAMKKFNTALSKEDLFIEDPKLYAMLLDNKAYTRLLSLDTTGILSDFNRALRIRDSIGHEAGVIISKIHLSEYYLVKKDTIKAIILAKEANRLARTTSNNRDVLASLKFLTQYDKNHSAEHLSSYIRLSDSLLKQERATRNKFAKIKYDSEVFIAENQKLYSQRNIFFGITVGFSLLGLSGFIIKKQRTKNRELSLRQEQQEANEKIFQLLFDQQNIKEASVQKERIRLSEELHEGVLAKLFGLRLSLSSLNSRTDKLSIDQREIFLEDLKELGKEIRQLSHELNSPLFNSRTGYLSILEEVLSPEGSTYRYEIEIQEEIQWKQVSGSVKLHFLRILQEAVKNIKAHADASSVKVSFILTDNFLSFFIEDNGRGFQKHLTKGGKGFENMASRATAMEGKIMIDSRINQGTKIQIQVPI